MSDVLAELQKQKLATEVHLTVEQTLCHPKNRGNLGFNPYNCHKVGADVEQVGAKKEALRSVAIELSPNEKIRNLQIAFNLSLIHI